ncbi:DUF4157 domain-containing protein [Sphingomonas sp. HF-S4]|uniref:DUF4157 domain-containing protein n=1 Tax=Sphingomonas agrestis TaxID=3080540 RepID=A0ABU3Y4L0_9SPHN|nr:DUF4157 domain-containing protein [Sphingomonas sp. HF-S4]MDV3456336.1 DUF4157 domain-containing protein [Sphingomonas sp. HF-S4]
MRGTAARKSAEATPAPRAAEPGKSNGHRRVQTSLKLSDPGDAAEREAVATARTVMRMPEPVVSPRARVPMLAARAPSAAPAPSKAPKDEVSPELTAEIKSLAGSGRPLSPDTRSFLEPRFKANFAGVRVHTGGKAENLATRLGARAFTFGKDIFFNAGAYKPDSPEGMELIAHELTHTIQQREVVQRDVIQREEAVTVQQRTGPEVQRGIVSEALDWIADKANVIPGFRLFTIIIGRNPVNMSSVDRSGANILRALIEFIPGGGLIVQALENHGIFEKGGKFIEDQFAALRDLGGAVRDALMEFIDSLGWRDIFRLGSLWDRAKRIFTTPIDKAIAFGKGLVTGIAELVKDAIVKPLGRWAAANIPKWNLLVGVFGKNPISDEGESPASQLIGAFMELIGQQEIWQNIKQGNAVAKAWEWFQKAMKGALSLVTSIPGRVMSTIRSLTIFDIVTLVGAFQKIVGAFSSFVGDFIGWAGGTVLSLLEIIFSVVAPQVVPYLKKAGGAFSKIIKAPGTFISTLVKAGKQGFNQFKAKFVTYLRDALFKWLLGSAEGAGIYFPKSFAPLELLKLGLSVLGLTWANLRAKLVNATNETVVKALEEGFQIVKTLVNEGPAAAWQELLKSLSNLKNMVVDAAIDFVKGEVVKIAIEKLVSMLTPAGAFIQAIISIYRTITFIVDKLAQIGRLVAAFIDGIAALANGIVGAAANKVESVLAQGLSLAISFLANFAGLGNIPKKVMQLIKKIQAPVNKAMDKVVTWIVEGARKLGKFVAQAGVPQDPNARLKLASTAAVAAAKRLSGKVTAPLLNAAFVVIQTRYALTSIDAFQRGGQWFARIVINPKTETPLETAGDAAEDPAAKAVLALVAANTKIFTIVPKAKATLVYTKSIDGYILDAGSDTEGPSIRRANRKKGLPELPAVHIGDTGVLTLGAKVHQKRSSEAEKLKMYRDVMTKLGLGNLLPHVTDANVNAALNSDVRNAMRNAILDSPKWQTLSAFNQMISSDSLTGPGMQGELFEAWVVRHFGSSQGISDSKIKYKTASGVGLMDRSAGDKIVEIKSRVRPPGVDPATADDLIPQTKFTVAAKDSEQFTRYNEILGGGVEMITKSSGKFTVPTAFSGARYYFNFRGVATLFNARMPEPLRSKTVFYLGGAVIRM